VDPFKFHTSKEKLCDICGCSAVRPGVKHRALKAEESWQKNCLWEKLVKVAFGADFSIEPVKSK
jgi:hypothetical protein